MEEKKAPRVQPETRGTAEKTVGGRTAAKPTDGEPTIPVKFNNAVKQLTVSEAAELAQKGLKFDMIQAEYERICELAAANGKSVSEYIDALESGKRLSRRGQLLEMCGGNEELADYIMSLEEKEKGNDGAFDELRSFYPEFDTAEKLPVEVREAARLKGTRLLDEYLRYCLNEKRSRMAEEKNRKQAKHSATGSQRRYGTNTDPVNTEFLRGIWQK